MYVVTHIIVLSLLPIALILVSIERGHARQLKVRFGGLLFAIVGKQVSVAGSDNIEKGKGYLIVANYPSFYTSFVLLRLFPEALIVVNWFISRVPLFGQFMRQLGATFVNPKGDIKGIQSIDKTLKQHQGTSIIILPEGQRTTDGQIQRFKRGFIYILRNSTLDLLPVTLNGFYQLKPMKRVYLDPDAEPKIIIHKPVSHSVVEGMGDDELLEMTLGLIDGMYRP